MNDSKYCTNCGEKLSNYMNALGETKCNNCWYK